MYSGCARIQLSRAKTFQVIEVALQNLALENEIGKLALADYGNEPAVSRSLRWWDRVAALTVWRLRTSAPHPTVLRPDLFQNLTATRIRYRFSRSGVSVFQKVGCALALVTAGMALGKGEAPSHSPCGLALSVAVAVCRQRFARSEQNCGDPCCGRVQNHASMVAPNHESRRIQPESILSRHAEIGRLARFQKSHCVVKPFYAMYCSSRVFVLHFSCSFKICFASRARLCWHALKRQTERFDGL